MCVILDTCNNNTRIRGAKLIPINSCYTATDGLTTITSQLKSWGSRWCLSFFKAIKSKYFATFASKSLFTTNWNELKHLGQSSNKKEKK